MGRFGDPAILPGDDLMVIRTGDGRQDPDIRLYGIFGDDHEFRRRDDIELVVQKILRCDHARRILDDVDIQSLFLEQAPVMGDIEERMSYQYLPPRR